MTTMMDFTVTGEQDIHCEGCEQRITRALKRLDGVETVEASAQNQHISVETDPEQTGSGQLRDRLDLLGYDVTDD
jgi:copper chaperone CopZ